MKIFSRFNASFPKIIMAFALLSSAVCTGPAVNAKTSQSKPKTIIVAKDHESTWYESLSWGNGAALTLDLQGKGAPTFLAGAAPVLTFGCSSRDVKTSYWRLRAGFSAPGNSAKTSGAVEAAYNRGTAHAFGLPGTVTLLGSDGMVIRRFPIKPLRGGLETAEITYDISNDILHNADFIRVETPRIIFEASTKQLYNTIEKLDFVPCAAG
jgi:hypothetical protein